MELQNNSFKEVKNEKIDDRYHNVLFYLDGPSKQKEADYELKEDH